MSYMGKDPDMPGSVGELLSGRLPYTYLEHELVEYAEAMDAALQAIDGILEIDQLRARVAELVESLERIKAASSDEGTRAYCGKMLNRTPAQSLAKHDAEVKSALLRDTADIIMQTFGDCENVVNWMRSEANRIEQEAGV